MEENQTKEANPRPLDAVVSRLPEVVTEWNRLQEQCKYTYCAYCGWKTAVEPETALAEMGRHIETCEKHPVYQLRAANDRLAKALNTLLLSAESLSEEITSTIWPTGDKPIDANHYAIRGACIDREHGHFIDAIADCKKALSEAANEGTQRQGASPVR